MFNNIWSSACLCLEVSGLVLQEYLVWCLFVFRSIWSSAGLCSVLQKGLVCLAVLSDNWSSFSLCSAVLSDSWSSAGLCSALL